MRRRLLPAPEAAATVDASRWRSASNRSPEAIAPLWITLSLADRHGRQAAAAHLQRRRLVMQEHSLGGGGLLPPGELLDQRGRAGE